MVKKRWKEKIAIMRNELQNFCDSKVYFVNINEVCTDEYGDECPIFSFARRGKEDSARYWCLFYLDSSYLEVYSTRNIREAYALLPDKFKAKKPAKTVG